MAKNKIRVIGKYDKREDLKLFDSLGIKFTLEEDMLIGIQGKIAGNLIVYRNIHNLTQKELADKIKVSQAYIAKIENCDKNLSLKSLAKLVVALNGDLDIDMKIYTQKEKDELGVRIAIEDGKRKFINASRCDDYV